MHMHALCPTTASQPALLFAASMAMISVVLGRCAEIRRMHMLAKYAGVMMHVNIIIRMRSRALSAGGFLCACVCLWSFFSAYTKELCVRVYRKCHSSGTGANAQTNTHINNSHSAIISSVSFHMRTATNLNTRHVRFFCVCVSVLFRVFRRV